MLGIMLQKMWHKKWLNLSLLLGCVLLIATVVSFPLYQKAAYDRMIQDEFRNYIAKEGKYPSQLHMRNISTREKGGATIVKLETFQEQICEEMGVTSHQNIRYYSLATASATSDMNRADGQDIRLSMGFYSDLDQHVEITGGSMYSHDDKDDVLEVVVPQETLVSSGLLVGETLTFEALNNYKGDPVKIRICGVYVPNSEDPYYWQLTSQDMYNQCMMDEKVFREYFTGDHAGKYTLTCHYYTQFEYEDITSEQIDHIQEQTTYYLEKSKYRSVLDEPAYYGILNEYLRKVNRISATLIILQVPVLIMLSAFLFMISGQMYEMEKNEISVIKSRGSSGGQIFRLYLYQGLVLTIVGALLAFPLAAIFSRALGSVRNFLDFDTARELHVVYTEQSYCYGAAAMLVTLLSITIPAIRHSKVSIVNLKQSRAVSKKAWWQKIYLDFVLIGVSLYGYYSFHKNQTDLSGSVLAGESLDPLLYLSSSVFIVGTGLLFIRLQPLLVKLVFTIGKRFWHPASFIAFMETIKQGGKQQLIILFLILTVSNGIYHSTVARTILENAIDNTQYNDGCDMVLAERWDEVVDSNGSKTGAYVEPDYKKYASMPFAEGYTRVYHDEAAYVPLEGSKNQVITLLGIHTREFGEMTYVDKYLLGQHYYEYLNTLADNPRGALVSENFKTKLGYKEGDTVYFSNGRKTAMSCVIVGFMPYFPTYAPEKTDLNPDGTSFTADQYFIVTHYALTRQELGTLPYEVWVDLKDGTTTEEIYNWIEANHYRVKKYVNRNDDLEETMEDPLLQGTNGVLTMGFVVTMVLCGVGYLIYWIMSIKDRELIFGVLRATGFHKGEILHMLLLEQIFAGVLAVLAGIGIGTLSARMFVPIIQTAFASATQVLPLRLITNTGDLHRLYGFTGGVMLLSLAVLVVLLFRMNVTKALKLGEE
ncbi:MAG: ABC transporter permease [Lachnospiraceae bacterium]|nr:ABC transporter permease [Lachnospiraceae bacterium]